MKYVMLALAFACALSSMNAQASLVHNRLRMIAQGKAEAVREELPELNEQFPSDPGIIFLNAVLEEDATKAEGMYETIIKMHPQSEWADDVQWRIVQYYALKRDTNTARKELAHFRKAYPTSEFLLLASDVVKATVGDGAFTVPQKTSTAVAVPSAPTTTADVKSTTQPKSGEPDAMAKISRQSMDVVPVAKAKAAPVAPTTPTAAPTSTPTPKTIPTTSTAPKKTTPGTVLVNSAPNKQTTSTIVQAPKTTPKPVVKATGAAPTTPGTSAPTKTTTSSNTTTATSTTSTATKPVAKPAVSAVKPTTTAVPATTSAAQKNSTVAVTVDDGKRYGLQVGIYSTLEAADAEATKFRKLKMRVNVDRKPTAEGERYFVVIGHYLTKDSAEKNKESVQLACECDPTIVLKEN